MIRPRLRDGVVLIDRPDDSVLVSPTPLVLPALTAAERRWLADVNGLIPLRELLECAPSGRAAQLLDALREVGALVDGTELPASVRVCTANERMALLDERDALSLALDSATADAIVLARRRVRMLVSGEGVLADAMRHALGACGFSTSGRTPSLVVLARRGHVDVFDDDGCTSLDLPHLQLRALAHRARVGPFVVPGETSCLRCAHAAAIDADPHWPVTSLRLARSTASQELRNPTLLHHVVAAALSLITAWTDFGVVSSNASTEFALPGPTVRQVDRPRHPLCGCGWNQPGRADLA